jgi:hypothetical protein
MHYANGREAKVGDQVAGRGYNIKGSIVGIVAGLTAGADTCNVRILTLQKMNPASGECAGVAVHCHCEYVPPQPGETVPLYDVSLFRSVTEYGAVKDFLHVDDVLTLGAAPAMEIPIRAAPQMNAS